MLLAAVNRYPAVWAFEIDVSRWGPRFRGLTSLEIHRVLCGASRLVVRVRTVCMLAHERRSLADLRYWRVRERIEQIVLGQDKRSLDALRIDVLVRLERLVEAAFGRSRERSSRGRQLRLCRTFGGMISRR